MRFYTSVHRKSNKIFHVGYRNGKRFHEVERFQPTLYLPSNKESKLKTLKGVSVSPLDFDSIYEAKQFVDENTVANMQIYGTRDWVAQYISEQYARGCIPDPSQINITFIDIEVQSDQGFPNPTEAKSPITAITIKNTVDDTFHVWGLGDFDTDDCIVEDKIVRYYKCDNESDLLKKFFFFWANHVPDVITGWNVEEFDMPYIINRAALIFDSPDILKTLSIFKELPVPNHKSDSWDGKWYTIYGISQLDYLKLFKKFAYTYGNQESYRLDHIAYVVLGEKKLDYSEYGSLAELYRKDHQKFINYNIHDVNLVERIDDKIGLIALVMTLSSKANCNYVTAFSPVKLWETYIYNVLRNRNIVVSARPKSENKAQIEGAYVKDTLKGMYEWVVSFDLNSLYPHLIMQYNMSPETIIPDVVMGVTVDDLLKLKKYDIPEDTCMSATGQLFTKKRYGIFPEVIDKLYDERSNIKKNTLDLKQKLEGIDKSDVYERNQVEKEIARFDNEQLAIKIMMNSLYGAMSNEWFEYYDTRIAEAITISGQAAIRWAEKVVNIYLNSILEEKDRIVAIDTDSLYVCMADLVEGEVPGAIKMFWDDDPCKFLDTISEGVIEPLLTKGYEAFAKYTHAYDNKMFMKREIIANKAIFTGKKRYIANVLNSEGVQYSKPKMKVTGIESVRSSTPEVCRKLIEKTLKLIMNTDEAQVQEFITEARKHFHKLPVEAVSFPRGVSELDKFYRGDYKGGLPIHVRASMNYNKIIMDKDLSHKYEIVRKGDKIKFCYLKMPNPIQQNVIGFPNILPPETKLKEFVDYDMQFDKSYVDPIKNILDVIGWSPEKINTLEDFFI